MVFILPYYFTLTIYDYIVVIKLIENKEMNDRRPVRSPYTREARTVRRPRDNSKQVKKSKHVYKYGGKHMLSDKQILVIGLIVAGAWISLILLVFAWVYFTWTTLP